MERLVCNAVMERTYKRIIAVITICAFLSTTLLPELALAIGSRNVLSTANNNLNKPFDLHEKIGPDNFQISYQLGNVKDRVEGTNGKTIIHIQDAHSNVSCQKSISGIFDHLTKKHGIKAAALEGGAGSYDHSVFTDIKDRRLRLNVSEYFLGAGRINGAELFAINNPGSLRLYGLEEQDLYLENLKAYRGSLRYKEHTDEILDFLEHSLNNLKRYIYSKDLKEFDKNRTAYHAEEIEIKEYLPELIKLLEIKKIPEEKYGNLRELNNILDDEKNIDFKEANAQRSEMIDRLSRMVSGMEFEDLIGRSVRFKKGEITQTEFYSYLFKAAISVDINVENKYPDLFKYRAYIDTYESLDHDSFFEEIEECEDAIAYSLASNDSQNKLYMLSKNLSILRRFFSIEFSRNSYDYYSSKKDQFKVSSFTSFIKKESKKYNMRTALPLRIELLDTYQGSMERFYALAFERDHAFLKNIEHLSKFNNELAILTGGFHTDNLKKLLREKGYSYISIMPKFDGKEKNEYLKLLSGGLIKEERIIKTALSQLALPGLFSEMDMLSEIFENLGVKADTDNLTKLAVILRAAAEKEKDFVLEVRDEDGKLVKRRSILRGAGDTEYTLKCEDAVPGKELDPLELAGKLDKIEVVEVSVSGERAEDKPGSLTRMKERTHGAHQVIGDEALAGKYKNPENIIAIRDYKNGYGEKIVRSVVSKLKRSGKSGKFIAKKLVALYEDESERSPNGGPVIKLNGRPSRINLVKGAGRSHAGGMGISIEYNDSMTDEEIADKLLHEAIAGTIFGDNDQVHLLADTIQDAIHAKEYKRAARLLPSRNYIPTASGQLLVQFLAFLALGTVVVPVGIYYLFVPPVWKGIGLIVLGVISYLFAFYVDRQGWDWYADEQFNLNEIPTRVRMLSSQNRKLLMAWLDETRRMVYRKKELYPQMHFSIASFLLPELRIQLAKLNRLDISDKEVLRELYGTLSFVVFGMDSLDEERLVTNYDKVMDTLLRYLYSLEGILKKVSSPLILGDIKRRAVWEMTEKERTKVVRDYAERDEIKGGFEKEVKVIQSAFRELGIKARPGDIDTLARPLRETVEHGRSFVVEIEKARRQRLVFKGITGGYSWEDADPYITLDPDTVEAVKITLEEGEDLKMLEPSLTTSYDADIGENVTRFYRLLGDSEEKKGFEAFISELAGRARRGEEIKVLSMGCSTGEEVYTVAIELLEKGAPADKIKVIGIDKTHSDILAARAGVYDETSFFDEIPQEIIDRYFTRRGESGYEIRDDIKEIVEFKTCDLTRRKDLEKLGVFNGVVFMNTFIYMDTSSQNKLDALYNNIRIVSSENTLLLTDCFSGRSDNRNPLYIGHLGSKTGFKVYDPPVSKIIQIDELTHGAHQVMGDAPLEAKYKEPAKNIIAIREYGKRSKLVLLAADSLNAFLRFIRVKWQIKVSTPGEKIVKTAVSELKELGPKGKKIAAKLWALYNDTSQTLLDGKTIIKSRINLVRGAERSHAGGMGINIAYHDGMDERDIEEELIHEAIAGTMFGDRDRVHKIAGQVADELKRGRYEDAYEHLFPRDFYEDSDNRKWNEFQIWLSVGAITLSLLAGSYSADNMKAIIYLGIFLLAPVIRSLRALSDHKYFASVIRKYDARWTEYESKMFFAKDGKALWEMTEAERKKVVRDYADGETEINPLAQLSDTAILVHPIEKHKDAYLKHLAGFSTVVPVEGTDYTLPDAVKASPLIKYEQRIMAFRQSFNGNVNSGRLRPDGSTEILDPLPNLKDSAVFMGGSLGDCLSTGIKNTALQAFFKEGYEEFTAYVPALTAWDVIKNTYERISLEDTFIDAQTGVCRTMDFDFPKEMGKNERVLEYVKERMERGKNKLFLPDTTVIVRIGGQEIPLHEPSESKYRLIIEIIRPDVPTNPASSSELKPAPKGNKEADRNFQSLCSALTSREAHIRQDAAKNLGNLGNKEAVEPLIEALKIEGSRYARSKGLFLGVFLSVFYGFFSDFGDDYDEEYCRTRKSIIDALGKLGDRRAVEPLLECLSDYNDVCEVAIKTLGNLGDKRAVEPLSEFLSSPYYFHRELAEAALRKLGADNSVMLEGWGRALKSRDSNLRKDAVESLGRFGDTRAVDPLIETLNDRNGRVIEAAIKALGNLGDTSAVEPLSEFLSYPSYSLREAAEEALRKLGGNNTVMFMGWCKALKDPDSNVRASAAESLGKFGDKVAVEPLIVALKIEESRYARSKGLFLGFFLSVFYGFFSDFGDDYDDEYCRTRKSIIEALGKLGDKRAFEPLLECLSDYHDVCVAAIKALGNLGDKRAVGPVAKYLSSDSYPLREAAIEALGTMGPEAKEAIPELTKVAFECEDASLCPSAIEAVCRIDPELWEELICAFVVKLKDMNAYDFMRARETLAGAATSKLPDFSNALISVLAIAVNEDSVPDKINKALAREIFEDHFSDEQLGFLMGLRPIGAKIYLPKDYLIDEEELEGIGVGYNPSEHSLLFPVAYSYRTINKILQYLIENVLDLSKGVYTFSLTTQGKFDDRVKYPVMGEIASRPFFTFPVRSADITDGAPAGWHRHNINLGVLDIPAPPVTHGGGKIEPLGSEKLGKFDRTDITIGFVTQDTVDIQYLPRMLENLQILLTALYYRTLDGNGRTLNDAQVGIAKIEERYEADLKMLLWERLGEHPIKVEWFRAENNPNPVYGDRYDPRLEGDREEIVDEVLNPLENAKFEEGSDDLSEWFGKVYNLHDSTVFEIEQQLLAQAVEIASVDPDENRISQAARLVYDHIACLASKPAYGERPGDIALEVIERKEQEFIEDLLLRVPRNLTKEQRSAFVNSLVTRAGENGRAFESETGEWTAMLQIPFELSTDDPDSGLEHFQAMLKEDSPYYDDVPMIGTVQYSGQETERLVEALSEKADGLTDGSKIKHYGQEYYVVKGGEQFGEKDLIVHKTIYEWCEKHSSDGNFLAMLTKAMTMRTGADYSRLKDHPQPAFVFSQLDRSPSIFENHTKDGFIGVNRILFEKVAEHEDREVRNKIRQVLLQVGFTHELEHEVKAYSEELLTEEDVRLTEKMCESLSFGIDSVIEALEPTIGESSYIDMLIKRYFLITSPHEDIYLHFPPGIVTRFGLLRKNAMTRRIAYYLRRIFQDMDSEDTSKTKKALTEDGSHREKTFPDPLSILASMLGIVRYAKKQESIGPEVFRIALAILESNPENVLETLQNVISRGERLYKEIGEATEGLSSAIRTLTAKTALTSISRRYEKGESLDSVIDENIHLLKEEGHKAILKQAAGLHKIEFSDSGETPNDSADIAKNLLETLPPVSPKEPFPVLSEETAARGVCGLDELRLKAGMGNEIYFIGCRGRSLAFEDENGDRLIVKIAKRGEPVSSLEHEPRMFEWGSGEYDNSNVSHKPPMPVEIEKDRYTFSFDFDSLGDMLQDVERDLIRAGKEAAAKAFPFYLDRSHISIAYKIPRESTYLEYINDNDDKEDFKSAALSAASDLGSMAQKQVFHTSLINSFHAQGDELVTLRRGILPHRRYMWSRQLHKEARMLEHRLGAGDHVAWRTACLWPNIGKDGEVRDWAEVRHIKDIIEDPHQSLNGDGTFLVEQYPEEASNILTLHFLGEYAMALAHIYGDWLLEKGLMPNWEDDTSVDELGEFIKDIYFNLVSSYLAEDGKSIDELKPELEEEFSDVINWQRLARQMAFFMSTDYVKYVDPVTRDSYGREIWDKIYGKGVDVDFGAFRENTFDSEIGWFEYVGTRDNKRKERSLGPANGPYPIQELITANYYLFSLALAKRALGDGSGSEPKPVPDPNPNPSPDTRPTPKDDGGNLSCGTICEEDHEGFYEALDNQLSRQFSEYGKILVKDEGPGSRDQNVKARATIFSFIEFFVEKLRKKELMVSGDRVQEAGRSVFLRDNMQTDIHNPVVLGTAGCYRCVPIICQVVSGIKISNHLLHLPMLSRYATGETHLKKYLVETIRAAVKENFSYAEDNDCVFVLPVDEGCRDIFREVSEFILQDFPNSRVFFIDCEMNKVKTTVALTEGVGLDMGGSNLENPLVPIKETSLQVALTWKDIWNSVARDRLVTFNFDELLPEISRDEADEALQRLGHVENTKELRDLRDLIKEKIEVPEGTEIFFHVPEGGTELFWVGGHYAAAHFNKKGTRIHISLPFIRNTLKRKIRMDRHVAQEVAEHEVGHIKDGEHKNLSRGLQEALLAAVKSDEAIRMKNGIYHVIRHPKREPMEPEYVTAAALEMLETLTGSEDAPSVAPIPNGPYTIGMVIKAEPGEKADNTAGRDRTEDILKEYLANEWDIIARKFTRAVYKERGIVEYHDGNISYVICLDDGSDESLTRFAERLHLKGNGKARTFAWFLSNEKRFKGNLYVGSLNRIAHLVGLNGDFLPVSWQMIAGPLFADLINTRIKSEETGKDGIYEKRMGSLVKSIIRSVSLMTKTNTAELDRTLGEKLRTADSKELERLFNGFNLVLYLPPIQPLVPEIEKYQRADKKIQSSL